MKKSVRVYTGKGGRPRGAVRHTSGMVKKEIDEVVETKEIEHDFGDNIGKAIRQALTDNLGNLSMWLEAIGEDDPKSALTIFKDLSEYFVPKLQRTDSKIDSGSPLVLNIENISSFKRRKKQAENDRKRKNTE
ncbi:MAG: hypothetical protein ACKOWO_01265 [Sediminibacterium sp.]